MQKHRLRDVDGTEYDPETGLRATTDTTPNDAPVGAGGRTILWAEPENIDTVFTGE